MFRRRAPRPFSPEEETRLVAALGRAEAGSCGEVRVHFEKRCPAGEPLGRARVLFGELGLAATRADTGVLLYAR